MVDRVQYWALAGERQGLVLRPQVRVMAGETRSSAAARGFTAMGNPVRDCVSMTVFPLVIATLRTMYGPLHGVNR